jgi:hypothetical protein
MTDHNTTETTAVPEELRANDIHQADGKTLVDVGYELAHSDERVVVTPGQTLSRMEDLGFVAEVIEHFGFEKVHGSPEKAVFEPR